MFKRSEVGNQVLFGYSALKLDLFGILFLLVVGLAFILRSMYQRRPWLEERLERLLAFFQASIRRQMFYFQVELLAAMAAVVWMDDLEKRQQITLVAVHAGLQLSLAYFYNFAFFGVYL